MKLETFDFESQAVRVINRDGEPWFVAVDICRVLEIANTRDAVSGLDEDEKDVGNADTLGGSQKMNMVSESGLYALIFKSRKPQARKFRKWVTAEVLPAIRASGRFELRTGEGCALVPVEVVSLFSFVRQECAVWPLERQMEFGLLVRRYAKAMGVCFQAVDEPGIGRVFGFARPLMEGVRTSFASAKIVPNAEDRELLALLESLHAEHGDAVLSAEEVRRRAREMGLFKAIFKEANVHAQQARFGRLIMRHAGCVLPGGLVVECHRNNATRQYAIRREAAPAPAMAA